MAPKAWRPLARLEASGSAAQARHGKLAAAGNQHAGSALQPAILQLDRQKTVALERAGHDEVLCLGGEEAEALVIGRIANQQDGTVTTVLCLADGRPHQGAADSLTLVGGIDRQRT